MVDYNPNRIPVSIEASSKENLQMLFALAQDINSMNFDCISAPKQTGKKWIVWFYADFTRYLSVEEEMLKENLAKRSKL